MENTQEETSFEMTLVILEAVGIVVALPCAILATVELIEKLRHQKSNRPSPKE